jgi:hypothetical protein
MSTVTTMTIAITPTTDGLRDEMLAWSLRGPAGADPLT